MANCHSREKRALYLLLQRNAPPTTNQEGNLRIATFTRLVAASAALVGLGTVPAHSAPEPALADYAQSFLYDRFDRRYEQNGAFPCSHAYDWELPNWPIDRLDNLCNTRRIWLHENVDKTGHDICISPGSIRIIPERYNDPAIVAVGSQALCP